jgi:hypothetical protein
VDVLSRYAWCKPLKTKDAKQVDIVRYSTYGDYKVSIAERFIRTLKGRIWYDFIRGNDRRWIDDLDRVVKDYNVTMHSALGMSPREARTKEDELLNRVVKRLSSATVVEKPKYKLGDWVRISRLKGRFEKEIFNWSYEIFRIVGIRKTEPVLYELADYYGENIEGAFYESDLQPVKDETFFPVEKVLAERKYRGKSEKLVKFLGYKEPRWLAAEAVTDLK